MGNSACRSAVREQIDKARSRLHPPPGAGGVDARRWLAVGSLVLVWALVMVFGAAGAARASREGLKTPPKVQAGQLPGERTKPVPATARTAKPQPRTHHTVHSPTYTGLAFDTCSTPSTSQLDAWRSSPFGAVGVYLGGMNAGCPQHNLTSAWLRHETAAGWRLLPIWVGLQAPANVCSCASIDPQRAAAQGRAAASDAINRAAALGLRAGSAMYYDMEAYSPGANTTSTVLAFLAAWTGRLHARGYRSGVYSSGSAGISALVSRYGTRYTEPDNVWFADWDGRRTTSTSYIPRRAWAARGRLHQYKGNVTASYGGVAMNIDWTYLHGAAVAT
jgi:hypothetical protein